MKTIVVEDELNNLNLLSHFLKKYCPEVDLVASCQTKDEGVELFNQLNPDLLFLDIVLEENTAFELLEEIEHKDVNVIFVTAFDEYALKAFRYHAVDYLLKPLQIDELVDAVKRVKEQDPKSNFLNGDPKALSESLKSMGNKYVIVSNIDKVNFVKNEEILYCKSSGRYTEFFLTGGRKLLASKSLGEYESLLNPRFFFRIHKSYIVNLDKISNINKKAGNYYELKDGSYLPISRRRMESLIQYINTM
jgi:two-component system LytT family response regulator